MKNTQLDRIELMLKQVLQNQAALAGNQIRLAEVSALPMAGRSLEQVKNNSKAIIDQVRQCLGS